MFWTDKQLFVDAMAESFRGPASRRQRMLVLATASLLLGACASQPPKPIVSAQYIPAFGVAPLQTSPNQSAYPPIFDPGNALPEYPKALLDEARPPRALCAQLVVDADGGVEAVTFPEGGPECEPAASVEAEILSAAETALRTWRFDPAFVCTVPSDARPDPITCAGPTATVEPLRVSLAYRLHFDPRHPRARMGSQD